MRPVIIGGAAVLVKVMIILISDYHQCADWADEDGPLLCSGYWSPEYTGGVQHGYPQNYQGLFTPRCPHRWADRNIPRWDCYANYLYGSRGDHSREPLAVLQQLT